MDEKELKDHLFELSLAIDKYSVAGDYKALRTTHYDNMKWMRENGLTEEYYKVLLEDIKGEE